MKKFVFAMSALFVGAVLAADLIVPQVESVTTRGGTGRLDVTYRLDKPAVVTFDIVTNGVPVDLDILGTATGDVWRLLPAGQHAFSWKIHGAIPEEVKVDDAKVRVKAWSIGQPPDYMVIDILNANGEIRYYETAGQLPGGIAHDDYKSVKLVMRKIPAAYTWTKLGRLGTPEGDAATLHSVLLTADYYLGVYEFTAAQNAAMGGTARHNDPYPYRGSFNGVYSAVSGYVTHTGLPLALPTASQWEFACRAGTTTDLYTGENLEGDTESANLDGIAWYGSNSGDPKGTLSNVRMHAVGLLAPNGFGLYDMIGNVWEYSHNHTAYRSWLDYVDPDAGFDTGSNQAARHGGSYDFPASYCRATGYQANNKSHGNDSKAGVNGTFNNNQGFRLCLPCQAVR